MNVEHERISCGCCKGPEADRCCCHIHQDIPMGLRAKACSQHEPLPGMTHYQRAITGADRRLTSQLIAGLKRSQ